MTLDLNIIWFILVGVLFTGYAMLDGFDLGIGALHLFTKDDNERRVLLNSIGPVWDATKSGLSPAAARCSPRSRMFTRRCSPVFTSRFICCSRR